MTELLILFNTLHYYFHKIFKDNIIILLCLKLKLKQHKLLTVVYLQQIAKIIHKEPEREPRRQLVQLLIQGQKMFPKMPGTKQKCQVSFM